MLDVLIKFLKNNQTYKFRDDLLNIFVKKIIMKKIFLFFVFIFLSFLSFSQYDDIYPQPRPKNCEPENSCPRNTLFHETSFRLDKLGLNWNSLNWDHTIICRTSFLLSFRLGINYLSFSKINSIGAPVDLNLMIGGGALMGEVSAGLNYLYVYKNYDEYVAAVDSKNAKFDDNLSYLAAMGRVGLRFERKHSIFFRLGWTPMISLFGNDEVQIKNRKDRFVIRDKKFYSMYALGIGYTF